MKKKLRKKAQEYTSIWRSRSLLLFLSFAFLFTGFSVAKELIRRSETQHEIEKLEEEVARLEGRNAEISDVILLLSSSTYQDKEAREKLGFQSPNEQVVVFPDRKKQEEIILPQSDRIDYIPLGEYQSNPEKWFYFFWNKL